MKLFRFLEERRPQMEQAYGMALEFDPIEGKRACRTATSQCRTDRWRGSSTA